MRRILGVGVVALLAMLAWAEPVRMVGYAIDDVQLDLGNVHLAAGVGASVLGADERVFASATALIELAPFVSVHAMGALPFEDLDDEGAVWRHLEAGFAFHGTQVQQTTESIVLEQSSTSDGVTRTTNTVTVNMPVQERTQFGVGGGVLWRRGRCRLGKESSDETGGSLWMPYAGLLWTSAVGQSARLDGYGRRQVYRFVWGGVDVVYAGLRDYDVPPVGDLNTFGLRVHGDFAFGRPGTVGLGGRVEIGALPGGLRGYILGSLSLTTNLRVLRGRRGRERPSPGGKPPLK